MTSNAEIQHSAGPPPGRSLALLRLGLGATGVADLAWLARGVLATFYWPAMAGSGGVGSVSFGISDLVFSGIVMPVPLVLHGIAQILARRAGADVRRWWWPHVTAVAVGAAGLYLVMRPVHALSGGLALLIAPVMLLGALVSVAQHVVLAIVILSGLQALAPAEDAG